MLKTLVVISALVAVSAAYGTTKWNPFGVVEGIVDCGSAGRLGIVDVTDCTRVPCHFIPHNTYDIAIRFTASVTSEHLSLHVYRREDATLLVELPINGVIQAGIEYELKFALPISADLAGTEFAIRFYILDLQTHTNEVCAEAAVSIGQA